MRNTPFAQLAEALGGTNIQAEGAVTANLATIKEAFQQGDPVILRRCGTWQVRATRARVGHNPKTGAAAEIPAQRAVRFVVIQRLKSMVDGAAIACGMRGHAMSIETGSSAPPLETGMTHASPHCLGAAPPA